MKKFLILFVILLFAGYSNGNKKVEQPQPEVKKVETQPVNSAPKVRQYDKLQNLFFAITPNITRADVKNYISENALEVGESERSGGDYPLKVYKIAYTKTVTYQNHAESGDYVEISFVRNTDTLFYATYYRAETKAEARIYNPQIFTDRSGYFYQFIEVQYEGKRPNWVTVERHCKNAMYAVNKVLDHK